MDKAQEKIAENALMCIVDAWLSSHSLSATRGEKLRLVDGIRNQYEKLGYRKIEGEPPLLDFTTEFGTILAEAQRDSDIKWMRG